MIKIKIHLSLIFCSNTYYNIIKIKIITYFQFKAHEYILESIQLYIYIYINEYLCVCMSILFISIFDFLNISKKVILLYHYISFNRQLLKRV
jgi:hypothetical protein